MQYKIVIIAMCLGIASAATWIGENPPKPKGFEDKEGCYVQEINDVISFGATIRPIGYCYRITCSSNQIHYASCGVISTSDPNCHVTKKDISKPHPECCPKIKCDEDNQID